MNKRYVRTGECNRCGDCCKLLPCWSDLPEIVRVMFRTYDANAEPVFKIVKTGVCSYLSQDRCRLYGSLLRPIFCQNFPNEPEQLERLPRCGYSFKEID